jgi:hypothetical protein
VRFFREVAGFNADETEGQAGDHSRGRGERGDRPDAGREGGRGGQAEDAGKGGGKEQQPLLERLALALERARIGEYVNLAQDPLRLIYLSFLAGMARGLGMVVGFAVLGAATIWVAQRLVAINLLGIGRLIAQLIRIVQENMIR